MMFERLDLNIQRQRDSPKLDRIVSIERALSSISKQHTPEGSHPLAVTHQWIHALAFGHQLFAGNRVTNNDLLDVLMDAGLYDSESEFCSLVKEHIFLKDHWLNGVESFSFIDLFAGIGGMRQGFERVGGKCVFSSEFEKNAQFTYFENYGEYPFGDITKIDPGDIPDHDVLVGGFPCQPFSHAGKKLGIEDTRGTLFHNIALIIQAKRPLTVVLENVRGLISHDGGHTLKVVLTTLINEGYHCNISDEIIRGENIETLKREAKKMVMRSKDFGVPQNRQRIYIVLWRNDLPVTFYYPNPDPVETRVGQILEETPLESYTISDRLWAGHKARKLRNKTQGKGFGYSLVTAESPYTATISARYYKDGSEILIDQHGMNPRKLTPREAGRLQGFPDQFILNPSKVQSYKQFGNSVTIPVVEAMAECIREQIIVPNRINI